MSSLRSRSRVLLISVANAAFMASSASSASPASNTVYDATCALCHQTRGAGLKGQFPRLAGRVDRMAVDPEARVYLIQTVLHGLAGRIEVDGAPMIGVMPAFESMSDTDVASVLNFLVGLGDGAARKKVKLFAAAEIAAVRKGPQPAMAELLQRRAELVAKGRVP
jgi:mono/diheme cytochrome c family protein